MSLTRFTPIWLDIRINNSTYCIYRDSNVIAVLSKYGIDI